jgi:hypothetical protein
MPLTLHATAPSAYVHVDNRALVLCNGQRGILINRAQGRWLHEALEIIAEERRATRSQQQHAFGGFFTDSGAVVLFAGVHDDLVSVELSETAFAALREEFAAG